MSLSSIVTIPPGGMVLLIKPSNMKLHKTISLLLLLFTCASGSAQEDSSAHAQFKLGINYTSALHYYGRTDSLESSAFFPLAEFWFNRDLYVNAAPVFIRNQVQSLQYAGTLATIGFSHTAEKTITALYFTKPFYASGSDLVQSALKAQAGISFSYLHSVLNCTLGADAKFSDKVDLGATAGIDHIFRKQLANSSVLVTDPSLYAYAGTQNFTGSWYKRKLPFLGLPGGTEEVSASSQKFNILAYELSLPLIYAKNKWMVVLTPAYILPQNLVKVPGRPDLSERGKEMFYGTLALKRTF